MPFRTDESTIGQTVEFAETATAWRDISSLKDFETFLNASSTITVITYDRSSALHTNIIAVLRQHKVATRIGLVCHKMMQQLGIQATSKDFVMAEVQGGSRRLVRVYMSGHSPSRAVAWITEPRPRSEPFEIF